ncbi:hypothetical protein SAMD00019534_073400 [Acytostelium subglobosum LB1]|uniref:hypothetical protein n=1 Tax=Acytostelium subglobosum LB1 TaxID=1410327 RepID=UPI000644F064|nr:hypothetical protein SAMD00019534_073400 [Acytostelium subglobosum LB1]GAM24165.1 hypothetical protein SAMD00019534_073400 [Acytostelium subglobosum LB1]|eukprot:XP_012753201.1 hypothetical protein SAMD00019534_073400 [Acytostelium subglobosum LB1]
MTWVDANNYCNSRLVMDLKGYLVTITTNEENDFIDRMTRQLWSPLWRSYWISGLSKSRPDRDFGIYYYSSGPESGTLMYDVYTDKCTTFCNFDASEPNLQPDDNEIYLMSYHSLNGSWNNIEGPKTMFYFVCEYGGLQDPYIPPIRIGADQVINITNYSGIDFKIPIDIEFTKRSTGEKVNCTNPVGSSYGGIYCILDKSGSGSYNVRITNGQTILNTTFQYRPPRITVIYPEFNSTGYVSLTKGSTLTVSGDNFASDSLMSIHFADGTNCANISTIKTGVLKCTLDKDILNIENSILPITIIADSIYGQSIKPAFGLCLVGNQTTHSMTRWIIFIEWQLRGLVDT